MIPFRVLFAVVFLLLSPAQTQRKETSIAGRVVRADNNEPISGARLSLTVVAAGSAASLRLPEVFSNATKDDGAFVYSQLAPNKYFLTADADGYVLQSYGPVELAAGKDFTNVVFRLSRTAAVSGRIVSAVGPVQGLEVSLVRPMYDADGRRTFAPVSALSSVGSLFRNTGLMRTNDRGEYRLFGIPPGRYHLMVRAPMTPDIQATPRSLLELNAYELLSKYETTFYPGEGDLSKATWIDLQPGADLTGMDLVVREQKTYRVRGRIVDEATGQAPAQTKNQFVSVGIFARSPVQLSGSRFFSGSYRNDGTFELANTPPGEYVVVALMQALPAGLAVAGEPGNVEAPARLARANVDVSDADAENVVVTVAPLARFSGRLVADGQSLNALPGFDRIQVLLTPKAAMGIPIPARLVREHTPPKADGTFVYDGVVPGEYELRFNNLPPNAYVKDARFGDADVLSKPINIVAGGLEALTIILSAKAGQIDGAVMDWATKPSATTEVTLIPNQFRDRVGLYQSAVVDGEGRFKIGSIPPGDYKLFAWEDIRYAYFDPELMRRVEDQGVAVHVSESSKQTIELRRISLPAQ